MSYRKVLWTHGNAYFSGDEGLDRWPCHSWWTIRYIPVSSTPHFMYIVIGPRPCISKATNFHEASHCFLLIHFINFVLLLKEKWSYINLPQMAELYFFNVKGRRRVRREGTGFEHVLPLRRPEKRLTCAVGKVHQGTALSHFHKLKHLFEAFLGEPLGES